MITAFAQCRSWRALLCAAAAIALISCDTTSSLRTLRQAPLTDSSFRHLLGKLYLGFAEEELEVYDWWSSKYFADKGLRAAYNQEVAPEKVSDWDIPNDKLPELLAAEAALQQRLSQDYIATHPREAATLQFTFDCWLEQQDETSDEAEIALCRRRFEQIMAESAMPASAAPPARPAAAPLGTLGKPLALAPEPILKPKPMAASIPPPAATTPVAGISSSYIIYFPWGATKVGGPAEAELGDIAAAVSNGSHIEVIINGHADRSGTDDYNMQLSQERAQFVEQYLMKRGVPAANIRYFAFGESDPEIDTPDDVREPQNRRVEIMIE